jgi:hypothetical protein
MPGRVLGPNAVTAVHAAFAASTLPGIKAPLPQVIGGGPAWAIFL